MRLIRSFRGALCRELDLGLSGLRVQAVQVLDVLVMLPMHVMGDWGSGTPPSDSSFTCSPCLGGGYVAIRMCGATCR